MSNQHDCLLMFSGGRDSTLAALRLVKAGRRISLVTISSLHLTGVGRVRRRLTELARLLPPETPWSRVEQPGGLMTDVSFYERTCLPCHHAYVVAAAAIAGVGNARCLAFGYTQYQSSWPEQSPLAIQSLGNVLRRHGIELLLPVTDLVSREQAMAELNAHGIDPAALEQKCSRQVDNVTLDDERLAEQVGLWETAIDQSMARLADIPLRVLESANLGAFS